MKKSLINKLVCLVFSLSAFGCFAGNPNITIMVDVSESMCNINETGDARDEKKVKKIRQLVQELLKSLAKNEGHISIVMYAQEATVIKNATIEKWADLLKKWESLPQTSVLHNWCTRGRGHLIGLKAALANLPENYGVSGQSIIFISDGEKHSVPESNINRSIEWEEIQSLTSVLKLIRIKIIPLYLHSEVDSGNCWECLSGASTRYLTLTPEQQKNFLVTRLVDDNAIKSVVDEATVFEPLSLDKLYEVESTPLTVVPSLINISSSYQETDTKPQIVLEQHTINKNGEDSPKKGGGGEPEPNGWSVNISLVVLVAALVIGTLVILYYRNKSLVECNEREEAQKEVLKINAELVRVNSILSELKFKQKLAKNISKLWGVLKFNIGGEIFLGGQDSGYLTEIPGTNYRIRFYIDPDDTKILRIEPKKDMHVSYLDARGNETSNQYIDYQTRYLRFKLFGHLPEIVTARFDYLNYIQERLYKAVAGENNPIGQNNFYDAVDEKSNLTSQVKPHKNAVGVNDYVGRDQVVNGILKKIRNKDSDYSCVICGISHSGKTSLINQIQRQIILENDPQHFHMVILTYRQWLNEIQKNSYEVDSWDVCREWLERFMVVHPVDQNKKKVFVIDDYDFFYHKYGGNFGRFLCFYHSKHNRDDRVHLILAGQRSADFFMFDGHQYEFPAGLERITLKGFDVLNDKQQSTDFIDGLLAGAGLSDDCITPSDKDLILKLSSGYPYFIMVILNDYLQCLSGKNNSFKITALSTGFIEKYREVACGDLSRFTETGNFQVSLALILDKVSEFGGTINKERLIDKIVKGEGTVIEMMRKRALLGITVLESMGFLVVINELVSGEPQLLFNKNQSFFENKIKVTSKQT